MMGLLSHVPWWIWVVFCVGMALALTKGGNKEK